VARTVEWLEKGGVDRTGEIDRTGEVDGTVDMDRIVNKAAIAPALVSG
jgi:hypothetical protein